MLMDKIGKLLKTPKKITKSSENISLKKETLKLNSEKQEKLECLLLKPDKGPFLDIETLPRAKSIVRSKFDYYKNNLIYGLNTDKKYILLDLLGSGAFGCVYKGYDIINKRFVAVKVQKNNIKIKKSIIDKMFETEISNLKIVSENCETLVCILDYGKISGVYYIVMEFIEGLSLEKFISDSKTKATTRQKISIIKQLLKAVNLLHGQCMGHLDIKTENIMINPKTMKIKLVDLGGSCLGNKTNNICDVNTECDRVHTFLYTPKKFANTLSSRMETDKWAIGIVATRLFIKNYKDFKDIIIDKNYRVTLDSLKMITLGIPNNEKVINLIESIFVEPNVYSVLKAQFKNTDKIPVPKTTKRSSIFATNSAVYDEVEQTLSPTIAVSRIRKTNKTNKS